MLKDEGKSDFTFVLRLSSVFPAYAIWHTDKSRVMPYNSLVLENSLGRLLDILGAYLVSTGTAEGEVASRRWWLAAS